MPASAFRPRAARLSAALAALMISVSIVQPQGAHAQIGGRRAARDTVRDSLVARIDSLVTASLRDGPIAGLSVAVVQGRDTIVMKGYGFADLEHEVRATAQTVFRVGSVTKQFTSSAIMQLVEQGKIGLDDSLARYLPGVPDAWRPVKIRQLLNHTSGIPSYTDLGPRWAGLRRNDMAPDSIVALVRGDTLNFAPGTRWRYNNTGYVLLGMILEKVTGKPYAEYLGERLFTPLGLTSTTYCSTRPLIKHRADGYEPVGRQLVNAEYLSMTQPFSAGALCSTARDLVKWQNALVRGKVVSPASFTRMSTPETLTDGQRLTYGFGLMAESLGTHRIIGHGGGINGFITHFAHYPDDSMTVAVLSNTAPSDPNALGRNIARAVLRIALVAPPARPKDLPLTAQERARYLGSYALRRPNGETLVLRVFEEDGQLLTQATGQRVIRLLSQGSHVFGADFDPSVRVTFTIDGDRATRFSLLQGGATMVGERVP